MEPEDRKRNPSWLGRGRAPSGRGRGAGHLFPFRPGGHPHQHQQDRRGARNNIQNYNDEGSRAAGRQSNFGDGGGGRGFARGNHAGRGRAARGGFNPHRHHPAEPPTQTHRPRPPPLGEAPQGASFGRGQHQPPPPPPPPQPASGLRQISEHLNTFWWEVHKRVRGTTATKRFDLDLRDESVLNLWRQLWVAAAAGAHGPLESLIRALLLLPQRAATMPPAHQVLAVMSHAVAGMKRTTPSQQALFLMDGCLDVVSKRLHHLQSGMADASASGSARSLAQAMRAKASEMLSTSPDPEVMTKWAKLVMRVAKEMDQLVAALEQMQHSSATTCDSAMEGGSSLPVWAAWRQPTVGWLLSGRWLRADGLRQSYQSVDEYTQALHSTMTLLTFYWGAGAVWQRCKSPGNENKMCNEPLLAAAEGHSRTCTARLVGGRPCGAQAAWRCPRRQHRDAICNSCLSQRQRALLGVGHGASTDIYDAVVRSHESRRDGDVCVLEGVQSRKPPQTPPNWKTTYRLKCAGLVAVVTLGSSGEQLRADQPIIWAEIVPVQHFRIDGNNRKVGGPDQDFQHRSQGRMALRLLGCNEKGHIQPSAEAGIGPGTRIAVIDLRIFVPEVLPVLSICGDPKLSQQLSTVPFMETLISNQGKSALLNCPAEISPAVHAAISLSEIDIVQRLSPSARETVIAQVTELAHRANMYGTQLQAFSHALANAMHCTQGPPGTGKSYVGVQLILALDIIRTAAAQEGHIVGPILTLSYKNHALDEVLLDLLSASSSLRSTRAMIRCGKPEDEELQKYTEQRTFHERNAEGEVAALLGVIRGAAHMAQEWSCLAFQVETAAFGSGSAPDTGDTALADRERDHSDQPSLAWQYCPRIEALMVMLAALSQAWAAEDAAAPELPIGLSEVSSRKAMDALAAIADLGARGWDSLPRAIKSWTLKLLAGLTSDIDHWSRYNQIESEHGKLQLVLTTWLGGAAPPPRCAGTIGDCGEQCVLEAMPKSGIYCESLHGCCFAGGCSNHRAMGPDLNLCEDHRCHEKSGTCTKSRMDISSFCREHSCHICLHYGPEAGPIEQNEPFSCKKHQCLSQGCVKPHRGPTLPVCEEHTCSLCLGGDMLDKVTLPNSRLCQGHTCGHPGCNRAVLAPDKNEARQSFCNQHGCVACVGFRAEVTPDSHYRLCHTHRCLASVDGASYNSPPLRCQMHKGRSESFCSDHTCRACADLGLPLTSPATDFPPRNTCSMHPLCSYMYRSGEMCVQLACHSSDFCQQHLPGVSQKHSRWASVANLPSGAVAEEVKATCHGTTTKGKPCKTTGFVQPDAKDSFYCEAHLAQAPALYSDSESDDDSMGTARSWSDVQDSSVDPLVQDAHNSEMEWETWRREGQSVADVVAMEPRGPPKSGSSTSKGKEPMAIDTTDEELVPAAIIGSSSSTVDQRARSEAITLSSPRPGQSNTSDIHPDKLASAPLPATQLASGMATEESATTDATIDSSRLLAEDAEDGEDVPEALEGTIHPDEMMLDDLDLEDPETNDDQERLREVLGVDDLAGEDDSGEEAAEDFSVPRTMPPDSTGVPAEKSVARIFADLAGWSWEMTPQDRLKALAELLRWGSTCSAALRKKSAPEVETAKQDLAAASAMAFKSARVIGATVTGAARRLDALRAAEPFAMVVEEACEVMEPMLISVVAVPSLQKLELVGDHYQLPAFVQNCWFNLEATHPSIKVSLFERLVTHTGQASSSRHNDGGPASDICTILDEQRRMRPAIADLTRGEYARLIEIQDHHCTVTRRVGDEVVKKQRASSQAVDLRRRREMWCHGGQVVPGIQPQEFFWDIANNSESRPVAGLSACNATEASYVVGLVSYLMACGTPPASISVITPYKGQKMAIIKSLRECDARSGQRQQWGQSGPNRQPAPTTGAAAVMVSTVDRYQGDENDVIILSLVRTKSGNRFVALRNRFIVAASRARLAFYIVGSVRAVSGGDRDPPHWLRLLEKLSAPAASSPTGDAPDEANKNAQPEAESDTEDSIFQAHEAEADVSRGAGAGNQAQPMLFSQPRIGAGLPVCCPHHPSASKATVKAANAFPTAAQWSAFCKEPCSALLPWCQHPCGTTCHAPHPTRHTAPEACTVELTRPCPDHIDKPLVCGRLHAESTGSKRLADALKAFKCHELVNHSREECCHSINLPCYKYKRVVSGSEPLAPCAEKVEDFYHPACNHVFKSPSCTERQRWETKPPRCEVVIEHQKPCGHRQKMVCWARDTELANPKPCLQNVQISRPRCGHKLPLRCCDAQLLSELWDSQEGISVANQPDMQTVLVEFQSDGSCYGPSETCLAQSNTAGIRASIPKCKVNVDYRMECGHVLSGSVHCDTAFEYANGRQKPAAKCSEPGEMPHPLCGHNVQLPCWVRQSAVLQEFPCPVTEAVATAETSGLRQVIPAAALSSLPELSADVTRVLRFSCKGHSHIQLVCGHTVRVSCSKLAALSAGKTALPQCCEQVARVLPCGHQALVECHKKEAMPPPKCKAAVTDHFQFPCKKHSIQAGTCWRLSELRAMGSPRCPEVVEVKRYRCSHTTFVPCHQSAVVAAPRPGKSLKDTGGVLIANSMYCEDVPDLQECRQTVTFQHSRCGHQVADVLCHQAFKWASDEPLCDAPVDICSPLCGHALTLPCHEAEQVQLWQPWGDDPAPWREVTQGFDGPGQDNSRTCPLIDHKTTMPEALPQGIRPEALVCGRESMIMRSCGHSCLVPCTEAYKSLQGRQCREPMDTVCEDCGFVESIPCSDRQAQEASNVPRKCTNTVSKRCTACGINDVRVQCFKKDVQCKAEATGTLPCGHEVTWTCGSEEDPRNSADPCLACVLPKWDKAVDEQNFRHPPLAELLRHAQQALPEGVEVVKQQVRDEVNWEPLSKAWKQIVTAYRDCIREACTNMTRDLEAGQPPLLCDLKNFDVVFRPVKDKTDLSSATQQKQNFPPRHTPYGHGVSMLPLTLENVQKCCSPGDDGLVQINLAVAFRHRALEGVPPFQAGKASPKNTKKANRLAMTRQATGYDHVVSFSGDGNNTEAPPRVYWISGAVVFLGCWLLRIHKKCPVCQEYKLQDEGFHCPDDHYLCWECFGDLIESASQPGAMARQVDVTGLVRCPEFDCTRVFEMHHLATQPGAGAHQKVFDDLISLRSNAHLNNELPLALSAEGERLKAEFRRIQKIMDVDQREAELLRMEIVDNILTLRCPTCRMAFYDFVGCFALTCSNTQCRNKAFCAWCLSASDDGRDSHEHVRTCRESQNHGDYYGTIEEFHSHHRRRQGRLIRERLSKERPGVRQLTLQLLKEDLKSDNGTVIHVDM